MFPTSKKGLRTSWHQILASKWDLSTYNPNLWCRNIRFYCILATGFWKVPTTPHKNKTFAQDNERVKVFSAWELDHKKLAHQVHIFALRCIESSKWWTEMEKHWRVGHEYGQLPKRNGKKEIKIDEPCDWFEKIFLEMLLNFELLMGQLLPICMAKPMTEQLKKWGLQKRFALRHRMAKSPEYELMEKGKCSSFGWIGTAEQN